MSSYDANNLSHVPFSLTLQNQTRTWHPRWWHQLSESTCIHITIIHRLARQWMAAIASTRFSAMVIMVLNIPKRKNRHYCFNIWALTISSRSVCTVSISAREKSYITECPGFGMGVPVLTEFEEEEENKKETECISTAPFHVKHAQLRWTSTNTKMQNTCI